VKDCLTMRSIEAERLAERLSEVLDEVQAGEATLVTRKGQVIARLEPVGALPLRELPPELADSIRGLLTSGRLIWGGKLPDGADDFVPVELTPGPTISDIIVAQRRGLGADGSALSR
jgi:hypothetical protein